MVRGKGCSLLFTLFAFIALSVVWTWPLAAHLSSRVPHDPGDPLLNTWILWWNTQALPFTEQWWSPPIFFPLRGGLALSEHLAGISPFTTPLILAGATPLAAYNVALILSFALSAFFTWLLVHRLTGSMLAAACAALIFGFSPYRAGQLAHLQVLTSQWMPLVLLSLHRYVDERRRRWLVVFGVAWLLQAMSNGYYLLFLPVLILLWLAWFVDWGNAPRTGGAIVAAWGLASLPLLPVLLKYREIHDVLSLSRPLEEIRGFSATLASFAHASPMLRFWRTSIARSDEDFLFPGVTVLVLLAAGAVTFALGRRWSSTFVFYAVAAVVMWLLAFGPASAEDGVVTMLRPYTLLSYLPGFEGLRVPARFAMLAVLCAAVAGGVGVAAMAPAARNARIAFGAVAVSGLLADGWLRPMPLFTPPSRAALPELAGARIIELPPDVPSVSVSAMYRSILHHRPVINGYSGHTPPHYAILSTALRREDPSPFLYFARGAPLLIVVDERRDSGGDFRRLIRDLPGVQRHQSTGAGEVYVLPPLPQERVDSGRRRWEAVMTGGPADRRIDLGGVRAVRTLEFPLRNRYLSLHTRLRIEVSPDGLAWSRAWEDWTGALAVDATLRDAREVPVRITLPDVAARYLRLDPAPDWLWREIRIYGP